MDSFITIKTFSYINELTIIRAHLESEGIECFVKDELTTQVNPFYSNAIGGIKLQVRQSDVVFATEILKEAGLTPDKENQPSKLYDKLDAATDKIPLLKNLRFEQKLFLSAAVIVSLIAIITYYLFSGSHHLWL